MEVKRVLMLDENLPKKPKIDDGFDCDESQNFCKINLTKNDLHNLKRQVFELRQELDRLKSRERCTKKVFIFIVSKNIEVY